MKPLSILRRLLRREHLPPAEPYDHPAIRAMSLAELADLPKIRPLSARPDCCG